MSGGRGGGGTPTLFFGAPPSSKFAQVPNKLMSRGGGDPKNVCVLTKLCFFLRFKRGGGTGRMPPPPPLNQPLSFIGVSATCSGAPHYNDTSVSFTCPCVVPAHTTTSTTRTEVVVDESHLLINGNHFFSSVFRSIYQRSHEELQVIGSP